MLMLYVGDYMSCTARMRLVDIVKFVDNYCSLDFEMMCVICFVCFKRHRGKFICAFLCVFFANKDPSILVSLNHVSLYPSLKAIAAGLLKRS